MADKIMIFKKWYISLSQLPTNAFQDIKCQCKMSHPIFEPVYYSSGLGASGNGNNHV